MKIRAALLLIVFFCLGSSSMPVDFNLQIYPVIGAGGKAYAYDEWQYRKDSLEAEKEIIETEKNQCEIELQDLKKQYESAVKTGDGILAAKLAGKISDAQSKAEDLKSRLIEIIIRMKEIIREMYTADELKDLETVGRQFMKDKKIKVLPVMNVFFLKKSVKFDTPPIIKDGRTLIPLRAVTEATGALVTWFAEEGRISITRGSQEIILTVGSPLITVNGSKKTLDVPAQLMNNRTMVPLRFIIENLQLKIKWDGETETIEIAE